MCIFVCISKPYAVFFRNQLEHWFKIDIAYEYYIKECGLASKIHDIVVRVNHITYAERTLPSLIINIPMGCSP